MNTLKTLVCSEFQLKGSKFLGFLIPYELFEEKLKELKISHHKATHFVYAYRILNQGQVHERFSDDGEPKGSSGMPILNVLRGENLINIGLIVVRYFGGILLGVGGLVRAYTKSVLLCVDLAKKTQVFIPFEFCKTINLECVYSLSGRLEYLAKKFKIEIKKKVFLQKSVEIELCGEIQSIEAFLIVYDQDLKFRS
ncbi:YigZ family protein [Helicobacter sp. 11S03491-1]|uniref:YigZ family protein n=1 Tax=Helicobacter sp. 11S03491-1 TaxID=1476196 RepID=UPI000BA5883C|nr:YigZ family protein [Helicobacter sp. 11S03491-1]PAF41113.1 hypothetical protein BKH45_08285 [Helicobacter sp. 11S03491-1]